LIYILCMVPKDCLRYLTLARSKHMADAAGATIVEKDSGRSIVWVKQIQE
jgi:hypothetical protein